MIFAVAVAKSVVFFDTEQASAFAVAKDIHYLTITDLAWAPDGRSLTVASSDGYCTVVAFQVRHCSTRFVSTQIQIQIQIQIESMNNILLVFHSQEECEKSHSHHLFVSLIVELNSPDHWSFSRTSWGAR